MLRFFLYIGWSCWFASLAGCSSQPPRVAAPDLDPASCAARALELYDKNGDGRITGEEASPALRPLLETADEDQDAALTSDEISARMEFHVDSRLGLRDVAGFVYLDGQPLAGAQVVLIPDPALEDVVPGARGVTDESGFVELTTEGSELPGVKPGFYRVEISKLDAGGSQLVPSRYNAETELGQEVGVNVLRGGLMVQLES